MCNADLPIVVKNWFCYFPPGDQRGICAGCNPGYFLNESKDSCLKCADENCALCQAGKCIACFNGFVTRNDGTCDSSLHCQAQNCSTCQESHLDFCLACSPGYVYAYKTKECVKGLSNCLAVMAEGDAKCFICNPGYYILSDGSCKLDAGINRISTDAGQTVFGLLSLFDDIQTAIM